MSIQRKQRSGKAGSGTHDECCTPMGQAQLEASLADLSYEEQLARIRPDMPQRVVGDDDAPTGAVQLEEGDVVSTAPDTVDADRESVKAQGAGDVEPEAGGDLSSVDAIPEHFPDGFALSLTLPKAWDNEDEARTDLLAYPERYDNYAFRKVMFDYCEANPSTANRWMEEAFGTSYDTEAKKKDRKKWALSLISDDNDDDARKKEIKTALATAHTEKLVGLGLGNNKFIPKEANEFAQAVGAVYLDGGSLARQAAMEFLTTKELIAAVETTSEAVRERFGLGPEDPAGQVKYLTISSHGSRTWMGGHGVAEDTDLGPGDASDFISGVADYLTSDVRVRLFACSTAAREKIGEETWAEDPEGSMSDAFRDALEEQGKDGGMVVGHFTSGDTTRNRNTRYFRVSEESSAGEDDEWHTGGGDEGWRNWDYEEVYGEDFLEQEYTRLLETNLEEAGFSEDLQDNPEYIVDEFDKLMGGFLSEFGWMLDLSSTEAYRADAQAYWTKKHPVLSDDEIEGLIEDAQAEYEKDHS